MPLPPDQRIKFFVFVIESPSPVDLYHRRSEGDIIQQAASLNQIPCVVKTSINLRRSSSLAIPETYTLGIQVSLPMPSISAFYGLIIYMYFKDNKQHKLPHIHVRYSGEEVIVSIPDGDVLEGGIPSSKMKLLQAWIEIHKEELIADWELAVAGEQPYKIDPLK
jgi:hypothetical protein